MAQFITQLDETNYDFPPVELALRDPDGLLAIGGDLSPARLVNAYRSGIFPWFSDDDPLLWWSPDPRCVFDISEYQYAKSAKKHLKRVPFSITLNHAFSEVVAACAAPRGSQNGTWILPEMAEAYAELHRQGVAHSIEVWHQQQLVGGLYGVCCGRQFSGESMFYRKSEASKIALTALITILKETEARWIDCQLPNPHLLSLGAKIISRKEYIAQLEKEIEHDLGREFWAPKALTHQVYSYVGLN
jgi:leucyl/phenylalanyl-tRNA--protein transferase